jgi:hypothetical protein
MDVGFVRPAARLSVVAELAPRDLDAAEHLGDFTAFALL